MQTAWSSARIAHGVQRISRTARSSGSRRLPRAASANFTVCRFLGDGVIECQGLSGVFEVQMGTDPQLRVYGADGVPCRVRGSVLESALLPPGQYCVRDSAE